MATLKAGVAQVDITPRAGVQLSGSIAVHRPAQWTMDPLHAKALVVSDGAKKLCFICADLTIINKAQADRIRDAAAPLGFPREAVMVHATQSHTAPSLGHFMLDDEFKGVPKELEWLRGGDPDYDASTVEKIVEAVRLADCSLTPVQMAMGRGIEGRVAFNRRAIARDGSAFMPPRRWTDRLGPVRMCCLEGPIDPEVGVACLRTAEMRMLSVLLHHTCHPVHAFARPAVSADWPGAWCEGIRGIVGSDCIPIVVNGCCGNVNPWDPFDPEFSLDHHGMGRILTETAAKVLEGLIFGSASALAFTSTHLKIPFRPIDAKRLREARRLLKENPEPVWADKGKGQVDRRWFDAANVVSVDLQKKREREFNYEVQAFRIGEIAVVGLPGEPFVEGQLQIKIASPAPWTFVAHCVNQYVGYIPVRHALDRGGHEVNTATWAKLAPEALDTIVATARKQVSKLFKA